MEKAIRFYQEAMKVINGNGTLVQGKCAWGMKCTVNHLYKMAIEAVGGLGNSCSRIEHDRCVVANGYIRTADNRYTLYNIISSKYDSPRRDFIRLVEDLTRAVYKLSGGQDNQEVFNTPSLITKIQNMIQEEN